MAFKFKYCLWTLTKMKPRFAVVQPRVVTLSTKRAHRWARAGRLAAALLVLAASFAAVPKPVYAYIDPGTGSLVIQAVLAAVLTVGVTAKVFWHQIKEKYRKLFHKDEQEK
jgi:hypothetical protein